MENKKAIGRFSPRKKPNYARALLFIVLLMVALFLYAYSDSWIQALFSKP